MEQAANTSRTNGKSNIVKLNYKMLKQVCNFSDCIRTVLRVLATYIEINTSLFPESADFALRETFARGNKFWNYISLQSRKFIQESDAKSINVTAK